MAGKKRSRKKVQCKVVPSKSSKLKEPIKKPEDRHTAYSRLVDNMTWKKPSPGLEGKLNDITTSGPFDRVNNGDSTSFVVLGDAWFDYDLVQETTSGTAWGDLCGSLLPEIFPEGTEGDIFIVGGLVGEWRYLFTKHERKTRLPQTDWRKLLESGEADYPEREAELEARMDAVKAQLKLLPENIGIQYFFGPNDEKNITESFGVEVDIYAQNVSFVHRDIKDSYKQLEALSEYRTAQKNALVEELKAEERRHHREMRELAERGRLSKEQKAVNKIRGIIKVSKKPETLIRLEKELAKAEKVLRPVEKETTRRLLHREKTYDKKVASLVKAKDSEISQRVASVSTNLVANATSVNTALTTMDNYFGNISDVESFIDNFSMVSEELDAFAKQFGVGGADFNEAKVGNFAEVLKAEANALDEAYSIRDSRITKRKIPLPLRDAIADNVKIKYIARLEGLHPEMHVHASKRNHILYHTPSGGKDLAMIVSGFAGGEADNPISDALLVARKRAIAEVARTKCRVGTLREERETDSLIPEYSARSRVSVPDFVISGHDTLWRTVPVLFADPNIKRDPTFFITTGPFASADKLRRLKNEGLLRSKEAKLAKDETTSGVMLVNYTPNSTRFTLFKPEQISLGGAVVKALHSGDEHVGKEHQKYRADFARQELAIRDDNISAIRRYGDHTQGNNYRGSEFEGRRAVRVDDQRLAFASRTLPGDLAVLMRSNVYPPILAVEGNHSRPEKNMGISMEELNGVYASTMLKMLGIDDDPKFDMRTLAIDRRKHGYGMESAVDRFGFRVGAVGHEGYSKAPIYVNGKNCGEELISHKVTACGKGDKTDPIRRTASWIPMTGEITPEVRYIGAGHTHLAAAGWAYGIPIIAMGCGESEDVTLDHSVQSKSPYGLRTVFPMPTTGAWQTYMSVGRGGPFTVEWINESLLDEIFYELVDPIIQREMDKPSTQKVAKAAMLV